MKKFPRHTHTLDKYKPQNKKREKFTLKKVFTLQFISCKIHKHLKPHNFIARNLFTAKETTQTM